MRSKLLLSVVMMVAATPALAQNAEDTRRVPAQQPPLDYTFSQGSGAIPALPLEAQTVGNITYLNGGIGDEDLAQLKAQSASYNLRVMLSAPNGEYISDVRLRVLDSAGTALLDVADAGPYLYAKLPAGNYTLETTSPGEQPQSLPITIGETGFVKKHITYQQQ